MNPFIEELKNQFFAFSERQIAEKQEAYMKHHFSFLGLKTPKRRVMQKKLFTLFHPKNESELFELSHELWQLEEREFQYAALDLLHKHFRLLTRKALSCLENFIRTKSWWDTVDHLAANCVGRLLKSDFSVMDQWILDENMWIRRSAIISQLRKKKDTDSERLFQYCLHCSHEKEFFIRKAIGWALREYSKHNPELVKEFIQRNVGKLSGLSIREAGKYLKFE